MIKMLAKKTQPTPGSNGHTKGCVLKGATGPARTSGFQLTASLRGRNAELAQCVFRQRPGSRLALHSVEASHNRGEPAPRHASVHVVPYLWLGRAGNPFSFGLRRGLDPLSRINAHVPFPQQRIQPQCRRAFFRGRHDRAIRRKLHECPHGAQALTRSWRAVAAVE